MRAALRAPDRVRGLGLIDTQSGPEPEEARPVYDAMTDEWVDERAVRRAGRRGRGHHHEPRLRPRAVGREVAGAPAGVHRASRTGTLIGRDDISDRLPEITAPAIVFHGEADAAIPMEHAEQLLAELPELRGARAHPRRRPRVEPEPPRRGQRPARGVPAKAFVTSRVVGWGSVFGVAGVVGWDEGSFAGSVDERPAEVGLEVVFVLAERVDLVDPGAFGFCPADSVVVLEPRRTGAVLRRCTSAIATTTRPAARPWATVRGG